MSPIVQAAVHCEEAMRKSEHAEGRMSIQISMRVGCLLSARVKSSVFGASSLGLVIDEIYPRPLAASPFPLSPSPSLPELNPRLLVGRVPDVTFRV